MASTGSFATNIPTGTDKARIAWSLSCFIAFMRETGFAKKLIGGAPADSKEFAKLEGRSYRGTPVVELTDLRNEQGDEIIVQIYGATGGKPIMGDADAEGTGVPLDISSHRMRIDLTTHVVDMGGKMSRKRHPRKDLMPIVSADIAGYFAQLRDQSVIYQLAGATGSWTDPEWPIPRQSDPDFNEIIINPLLAPSFGSHFIADGTDLIAPTAASVAGIGATDVFTLDTVDALSQKLRTGEIKLQKVELPDDPAAKDEPLYILYLTPAQHMSFKKSGGVNMRTMQANAYNRANHGSKSPLFKGEAYIWENILVLCQPQTFVAFNGGSNLNVILQADAATGNETTVNTPANVPVGRALLLGAQAVTIAYGDNSSSGIPMRLLTNPYNFVRAKEVAGDLVRGEKKVRIKRKDGTLVDHGVVVIDSANAVAP